MPKYNVYVEDVSVEAVFNRLGGVEGARALLRGELKLVPVEEAQSEEEGLPLTPSQVNLRAFEEILEKWMEPTPLHEQKFYGGSKPPVFEGHFDPRRSGDEL